MDSVVGLKSEKIEDSIGKSINSKMSNVVTSNNQVKPDYNIEGQKVKIENEPIMSKEEIKPEELVKSKIDCVMYEETMQISTDKYEIIPKIEVPKTKMQNKTEENYIMTFEEIKKCTIPSENGLYVPEILMLHFCKRYPMPEGTVHYAYWWYKYGVKDVEGLGKSLMDRGFLKINDKTNKYELTERGKKELNDNEYVPYMHKKEQYNDFTVWHLNKKLGTGDKSNFMKFVKEDEAKREKERKKAELEHKIFMRDIRKSDPELYKEFKELDDLMKEQEKEMKNIQAAKSRYKETKDLNAYIEFWEDIRDKGGLKLDGADWMFTLADLYIKAKRYEDAYELVSLVKNTEGYYYRDKAEKYMAKIEDRKIKDLNRKKKIKTKNPT